MTSTPPPLLALPRSRLAAALVQAGVPGGHAARLFTHLHKKGLPAASFAAMSPAQQQRCETAFPPSGLQLAGRSRSDDGTERLEFVLADGARVEGVLIPEGPRTTFCVSSQVGCAMACAFCATATLGLQRGLRADEIVRQVQIAASLCVESEGHAPLRNVVFMGMGEPLHHYEATRDAIAILTDPGGLTLAYDKITVSTVGLVPRIAELGRDFGGRIQLALSLNAGTDAVRRQIMPITARYDMAALREAIASYPLPPNRGVLIEYVLLAGLTDQPAELAGLIDWARGLPVVVNIIAWNAFDGASFRSPSAAEVDRVVATLRGAGLRASVRLPRGRREDAEEAEAEDQAQRLVNLPSSPQLLQ